MDLRPGLPPDGPSRLDVPEPARRPTLRERQRRSTSARIEAAALRLFEERGFDETTVDDIAAAAGVARATVFRHFGSKDDIVYGVEPELLDVVRDLLRQQPPLALDEIVVRYAAHVDANVPDLHQRAAIISVTPRLVERFAHVRTRWDATVARELAARRGAATPTFEEHVAAAVAMSALFVSFLTWATTGHASLSALTADAVAVVPHAFGPAVTPGGPGSKT